MKPASTGEFRRELTACLALVVPAGMTEESRRDWLTVAWGTLKDIPGDLLERGCAHARKTADHPAKIVPAILAEVGEAWETRKRHRAASRPDYEALPAPIENPCTPDEARAIAAEFGIPEMDGKPAPRGPLRKPTRADYIALGVPPETLDQMGQS